MLGFCIVQSFDIQKCLFILIQILRKFIIDSVDLKVFPQSRHTHRIISHIRNF